MVLPFRSLLGSRPVIRSLDSVFPRQFADAGSVSISGRYALFRRFKYMLRRGVQCHSARQRLIGVDW